jgi:hypothetical protein
MLYHWSKIEYVTPAKYDVAFLCFGNNCASLIIQYILTLPLS